MLLLKSVPKPSVASVGGILTHCTIPYFGQIIKQHSSFTENAIPRMHCNKLCETKRVSFTFALITCN